MNLLTFPDPNEFLAGQLHKHCDQWLHIAASIHQELTRDVLDWIKNGVNVQHFFRHFRGSYRGENFDSLLLRPPIAASP